MYDNKVKLLYRFLRINNFNYEANLLKNSGEKYKSFKNYFDKANKKIDEEKKKKNAKSSYGRVKKIIKNGGLMSAKILDLYKYLRENKFYHEAKICCQFNSK